MVARERDEHRECESTKDKSVVETTHTVLVKFKRNVPFERGITVHGNLNALKVASVWANLGLKLKEEALTEEELKQGDDLWYFLWTKLEKEVDVPLLASMAGISESSAQRAVSVLVGSRLVFPDGTTSKTVESLQVSEIIGFQQEGKND